MKIISLLVIGSFATLLSSCSNTPASRIQKDPALYAKLSPKHQALVGQGQIAHGMTKPAVYFALGHPDTKFVGERYGKSEERWDYNIYLPVYSHGFSTYYGHGRRGYRAAYIHPSVHYVPHPGSSVFFKNDKVIGWNSVRR